MKKIKLVVILMVLLCSTFMLMGFDATQKKVYDDAGILTSDQESKLQQLCVNTAQSSKIDIIVVTTADNKGKSASTYVGDFYKAHDFGYDKAKGDCVLLLIDMDGRETWVKPYGSGTTYLSEVRIDNILTAVTSSLKTKDYYGACESFVNKMGAYMKTLPSSSDVPGDGKTTNFEYNNKTLSQKLLANIGIKILIAAVAGIIAVTIMMFNAKSKMTVGCQTYVKDHKFDVRDTRDIFINTTVVKHKIETDKGGSGGSLNSGSGGSNFGGGGRSF